MPTDVVAAGTALTEEFAALDGTDDVVSYWSLGSPAPLRSAEGDRALILMRFPGAEEDPARVDTIETIIDEYAGLERDGITVGLAGSEPVFAAIGETIEGDLARAEMIAVPLTLLLLLFVFGGVVAAGLPVLVGAVSVFGAFMVLWTVTQFTDVSIFSINLVTALGLGLAIDYSLFIVSRFREERARGRSVDEAVIRTVETAGRTVAFSAITVAISLSALLIFPLYFLRSFAYGGIGVARRRHGDLGGVAAGAARRARAASGLAHDLPQDRPSRPRLLASSGNRCDAAPRRGGDRRGHVPRGTRPSVPERRMGRSRRPGASRIDRGPSAVRDPAYRVRLVGGRRIRDRRRGRRR